MAFIVSTNSIHFLSLSFTAQFTKTQPAPCTVHVRYTTEKVLNPFCSTVCKQNIADREKKNINNNNRKNTAKQRPREVKFDYHPPNP